MNDLLKFFQKKGRNYEATRYEIWNTYYSEMYQTK